MSLSFRTRVMVMATALVSATLAAVIAVGWSGISRFEVSKLDDRLCLEVRRLANDPRQAQNTARLENDLMVKLRLASPAQLLVRTQSDAGQGGFESANWPRSIDTRALKWAPASSAGTVAAPMLPAETPALTLRQPQEPEPNAQPNRLERPPRRDGQDPNGPPPDLEQVREPRREEGRGDAREGRPEERRERRPQQLPEQRPEQAREEWREKAPQEQTPDQCLHTTFSAQGKEWRAVQITRSTGSSLVAADLAATQAELQSAYQNTLTTVIPLALLMTGLGAWLLASVTMRPVDRLRNAMKGATSKALDQRLDADGESAEFRELITAYNTMLQRLELSFNNAARFSSDAAHELKTPLTILQGRLERALHSPEHGADRAALTGMLSEVGRLAAITRKLLLLSQADAGFLALHLTSIDLSDLLAGLVQDVQMLGSSHRVSGSVAPGLSVPGDDVLLKQLLNNLVTNAVRYCLSGGWIEVTAHALPGGVEVMVANATSAIGADSRSRFFDRFYRGDAAHSRQIEGSGLGLSLAREIARAHGGDLTLAATAPNEVRMRLWLPTTR